MKLPILLLILFYSLHTYAQTLITQTFNYATEQKDMIRKNGFKQERIYSIIKMSKKRKDSVLSQTIVYNNEGDITAELLHATENNKNIVTR